MKKLHLSIKSCLAALAIAVLTSCTGSIEPAHTMKFYVGSSNGNLSHSIYLCELDPQAQSFAVLDSFAGTKAGSYLAVGPDYHNLFAINQAPLNEEEGMASVTSFAIDPADLSLRVINSQSSEGSDICHIYCSDKGDYIFAANYGSGHATALPVREDGEIAPASSAVVGEGGGPVESRQQSPHAHQVMLDPGQNFLLVPDLGTDRVMIYAFDPESGVLTPNPAQAFFKLAPGAGPRHLAFHPDGKYLFVVNELNFSITACRWDPSTGKLDEINTANTVDKSHEGMKYPAAVRVHPNGKYVYASTRGENSCISVFRIAENGSVERIQVMEQVPFWPRDFNLDPSGAYLVSAGERSNSIALYTIDPDNGLLEETNCTMELPAPANILFIQ